MKKSRVRWVLFLASALMVLGGCATVPETGRRQVLLVPHSQEMELGVAAFEDLKKQMPVSRDAAGNAMVQRVGRRIAAVATNMPDAQWEFVLFENKEPNAFCLPGGKVGVHTGILPLVKDDAGLATVIGHEVAHAALRHGAERMSQAMLLDVGGQLVGAATGSSKYAQAIALAYGAGAQLGVELPHSRKQELEADRVGLRYMARAGYNPEAALAFWQRFSQYQEAHGGSGPPAFLRTHPMDEKRIEEIKRWLPEAKAEMRGSTRLR